MKWTLVAAFGPPSLLILLVVTGFVFGHRRYAQRNAVPAVSAIGPDRADTTRRIATSLLPPHQHPDDRTLAQMLALCDNRKKLRAAQHLQAQTGADLTTARRLVSLLA